MFLQATSDYSFTALPVSQNSPLIKLLQTRAFSVSAQPIVKTECSVKVACEVSITSFLRLVDWPLRKSVSVYHKTRWRKVDKKGVFVKVEFGPYPPWHLLSCLSCLADNKWSCKFLLTKNTLLKSFNKGMFHIALQCVLAFRKFYVP